jgi:hypothetical protein
VAPDVSGSAATATTLELAVTGRLQSMSVVQTPRLRIRFKELTDI